MDPLAEKYYSLTPYNFVANIPLLFTDPDGRRIDVNNLLKSEEGLYVLINMMLDLSKISGMNFTVSNGMLNEAKSDKKDSEIGGSSGARGYLRHLMGNKGDLVIGVDNNKATQLLNDDKTVNINTNEIDGDIYSIEKAGIDATTNGYGMAILHEGMHSKYEALYFGKNKTHYDHLQDGSAYDYEKAGNIENQLNVFRNDLGYHQKKQYQFIERGFGQWWNNQKSVDYQKGNSIVNVIQNPMPIQEQQKRRQAIHDNPLYKKIKR